MKIFFLNQYHLLRTALIKGSIGFKPPPAVTLVPAGPVLAPAGQVCPTCAANISFQNCDIRDKSSLFNIMLQNVSIFYIGNGYVEREEIKILY